MNKRSNIIGKILSTLFTLVVVLTISTSSSAADLSQRPIDDFAIFKNFYGAGATYDVWRTPAYPEAGMSERFYYFSRGYYDAGMQVQAEGEYLKFKYSECKEANHDNCECIEDDVYGTGKRYQITLDLVWIDGTVKKHVADKVVFYGPDNNSGIIFCELDDYAGLLLTSKRYDYTDELIYTPSIGKVTKLSELGAYDAKAYGMPEHKHGNWEYTVTDSSIVAECKAQYNCSISDRKLSLSLTATSQNYSSSAYTGANLDGITAWEEAGLTTPTIYYAGRGNTTYTSNYIAPTNAGTYTASITVDGKMVNVDFTIDKKKITVIPKNANKHIEKDDPELEYDAIGIVETDELKGITLKRESGETAGTYEITAKKNDTKDTNYDITIGGKGIFTIEEHDWSEYVDDNNANTETDGTKTATCGVCGKRDVKVVAGTKIAVHKESTVEETTDVGDGKIVTKVIVDASVPKTEIDNLTVETAKTLLDEEKLKAVEDGATVTVFLNVVSIENTVSAEDKSKIQNLSTTISSDAKVGMYLDLSLFKKISTEEGATRITDTNGKMIDVSITVPDNLVNTDSSVNRTYYIARIHDGSTELIPSTYDANTNTITVATDKFSTYALVYKDVAADATVNQGSNNTVNTTENTTNSPGTGDDTPIVWLFVLMMFSAYGIVGIKRRKVNIDD